jgi:hypothetical protein
MVDWIPIHKFKIIEGERILVAYDYKGEKKFSAIAYSGFDNKYKCGYGHVTHATRIELPREKTLHEKVEAYIGRCDPRMETDRNLIENVLRISKHHWSKHK